MAKWAVSKKGRLLGMGNPLLDISNEVDKEFLDKYKLKEEDAVLAEEAQLPVFKDLLEKEGTQFIAGGATQNSIRVASWMFGEKHQASYMGCIGKDDYGAKMQAAVEKDGVRAQYMVDEKTPTGTCAVCVVGKGRSLCTNLSAANNYKVDHLKEPDNMSLLEKAKVVYSAGFFITVCPEAIEVCAKHCFEKKKSYCMNLSAPFIMEVPPFKAVLVKTMPYIDYLFGNESEAAVWAKTEGWAETDVKEIAKKLSLLPKEGDKPRTVVITQGCDPTIVAIKGEIAEYPIIALPKHRLVDTNGAGDAYVGGFLYGLVEGKDMHYCCQAGAYAASVIVQRSGCTMPPKSGFSYRPPVKPRPPKKVRFGKVGKVQPEDSGINLMVKVVKVGEEKNGSTEVVVGDETGIITFLAKGDQAKMFKDDAIMRVQNGRCIMVGGFMRLIVDKWGALAPAAADAPGGCPEIKEIGTKDISATEYELK
eukprot:TRINITY_DN121107_c0_g1_i1.p1 TRINITY_DN121107_c0_g1~~TRINITY_DN121107_c0_g1_i1.p1  ORF type:complete len:476 (+),score=178.16 TRINITY_DN121107_c0_g1_i1:85-1512(+)